VAKLYAAYFFIWLFAQQVAEAQRPFTVTWTADNTLNSTSSSADVTGDPISFGGVALSNVNGGYTSGQIGSAANIQNWALTGCPTNDYVSVQIQPVNGESISPTQLAFYFSRSNAGPTQLYVRSSADNFTADIYSSAVTATGTPYQLASVGLSGGYYINQTGPITIRIYACAGSSGGTLRLDQIQIRGTGVLPVTLLSFTAKPEGDRVQLAWSTTSERNADRFMVEHSSDLREFVAVGEVAAKGTTDVRQNYGLTDLQPEPGVNYYRLKQLDFDGTTYLYKPVSAIIRTNEPTVAVYPNPADAGRIHLRLWNANDAIVRLLTLTGQVIGGQLERQSGDVNWIPDFALPPGLYFLEVLTKGQRRVNRVVVR
jgi:hypothetical protein